VRERETQAMASATFLEVLLAIFLPPVGVFLRYGCGVSGTLTHLKDILVCRCALAVTWMVARVNDGWMLQVEFWIDLLLTILGYIPGIIYAVYVLVA